MRVDLAKFKLLYEALFEIDYTGAVPDICVSLQCRQHPRCDVEGRAVPADDLPAELR